MSTDARFQQSRKEWATSADALADRCYREYFDVEQSDIYDVESLVDDVHDRDGGYRTHQILDYGGVDRIVDCSDRHVYIAQRFRPTHPDHRDLSLRVDNGVDGRHSELTKWLTAYRSLGFYPSVLAFGLYEDAFAAFSQFWLLDLGAVLDALERDRVAAVENETGDGTAAVYIPIRDLDREGCVLASWSGVTSDE